MMLTDYILLATYYLATYYLATYYLATYSYLVTLVEPPFQTYN